MTGHQDGQQDVLVAGSGAAGLTAALGCAAAGLRTLVCESAALLGGTSAISGGRVWVPGNHLQPEPAADRRAAARYLSGLFPGYPVMVDAFLDAAPAMARFVEAHSRHQFAACPDYPDYHPGQPGATLGGRCLDARPLSLAALHPLAGQVAGLAGHLPLTHAEWELWRYPSRYDWDLLRERQASRTVTSGAALVAALADGVLRAGGAIVTGHRLADVRPAPDGAHEAVLTAASGGEVTVRARHVVLATGGYDADPALRARHLPAAIGASAAAPGNTGAALAICARLGARLENLGQGWWMPLLPLPRPGAPAGGGAGGAGGYQGLVRERGLPRLIIVDSRGRRFADEAAPYHELCRAFIRHARELGAPVRAHLIVDEVHRLRYGLPGVAAGDPLPGWVVREPTLDALARRLAIDPAGLAGQVARWNAACADGADDEFGKGANPYDRYYGDPFHGGAQQAAGQAAQPNLGPLDEPPYYGLPIVAGTIGSKGGPVTDADGRVLGAAGTPLPGIYAAGNATGFWTADEYPGPGATLGIGMTFGYRAAHSIIRAAAAAHAGLPRAAPAKDTSKGAGSCRFSGKRTSS